MAVRCFFLVLALFCGSFAYNTPFWVLGPNIEYGMSGAVAPADVRGAFVPQANANFGFSWIEPLGTEGYGVWKPNKTNYMRFFAGTEVSPFYGAMRVGLGFAPLPPPFAILELRFIYSNENLFWNDVEMPMKPGEDPSIDNTWNAGYIFDRFYDRSSYALIQSFDMQLSGEYNSRALYLSFMLSFSLVDITSDYDRKSFDYMRGLPLYSRDYVSVEELFAIYNFGKNFSWNAKCLFMISGQQPGLNNTYNKESLSYAIISTGPLWRFSDGRSYLSVSPGFFTRDGNGSDFEDSIKERILLSVQYKYFWNFNFGKQ